MRLPVLLVVSLALAGCAQFPRLGGEVSASAQAAAWPRIAPLGPLLALGAEADLTPALAGDLASRAAALRARAARLQRPVIDAATRARMQAAQARNAP
jgi:hypothetical protein